MMKLCPIIFLLLLMAFGCNQKDEYPDIPYTRATGKPMEGIRIAWDYSSMQRLAPQGSRILGWVGYPRIRRLQNGTLMAVYETAGNGELIQSSDNGETWSSAVLTFVKHTSKNIKGETTDVNISNPELCQLRNGDLIMACNYRPQKEGIAPFAIAVKRSVDMGVSWSDDQVIYEAAPRFIDGCWEPAILELPDGKLQVYFANENPYQNSNEQNISLIESSDHGETWDKTIRTVCFTEGRRDGMSVPLIVDDEILVSIEDNNIGQFKPYIVRTKIADNWQTPVLVNSPNRESALKKPYPEAVYAGAPYITRVPSGEVILSYQTTAGRSTNWEQSTLEVAIGDKKGRNFEKLSRPFNVPMNKEAKWNSISLWDENTVVAAATTSFRSTSCEVWMIKGHIISELKIESGNITVDGTISTQEWGSDFPVFIGHQGPTNMSAALKFNNETLYIATKVNDKMLIHNSIDPLKSDGVFVYLDTENQNLLRPDEGIFKIWCNNKGETKIYEGRKGQWEEQKTKTINCKVKSDSDGYQIEFGLPFSMLKKQTKSDFRVSFGLMEYTSATAYYEENIIYTNDWASNTWIHASFQ